MAKQFSKVEISIIKNLMLTKSYREIAVILKCTKDDVGAVVTSVVLGTNIVPYQMRHDAKIAARPKKKKLEKVSRVPKAKQQSKEKAEREKRKEEKRRAQQEKLNIERGRQLARREPKYDTKQVDYTQLITVRIDRKTFIYAKPGEDIEALKRNFLNRYQKSINLKNDE